MSISSESADDLVVLMLVALLEAKLQVELTARFSGTSLATPVVVGISGDVCTVAQRADSVSVDLIESEDLPSQFQSRNAPRRRSGTGVITCHVSGTDQTTLDRRRRLWGAAVEQVVNQHWRVFARAQDAGLVALRTHIQRASRMESTSENRSHGLLSRGRPQAIIDPIQIEVLYSQRVSQVTER